QAEQADRRRSRRRRADGQVASRAAHGAHAGAHRRRTDVHGRSARGRRPVDLTGGRSASPPPVVKVPRDSNGGNVMNATRFDALADSPMSENRPTPQTARLLRDELLFQRATQTYLWALPLINTLGMKVGSEMAFGAGYNVLPVWKKRLDAKTLVT